MFLSLPSFSPLLGLCMVIALLIDSWLGEPKKWHPLVGFGKLARGVEAALCRDIPSGFVQRLLGILAWLLVVAPLTVLAFYAVFLLPVWLGIGVHILLLWFAVGAQSLREHALAVFAPLSQGDLPAARYAISRIVSRDTAELDESGVAKACVETVLENGNDAIFGALFWFVLFGGPGALLFRLANTLDAMWGYRTPRYLHFGWAAARLDDVLNYLPARLTAITYALFGNMNTAIDCWRKQAPAWDSPNAGPVMAAGAGALQVQLGGVARYHGQDETRPPLGCGKAVEAADILRALSLVSRGTWCWAASMCVFIAWRSG